ncbi:MAG: hypothetical protein EG825_17720, partial [Rhodocyclaceae bacterium]|nr:hypothetical protein [Rhodocyclaceae bacterium]
MKTKQQQAAELADELLRLNALVRARRAQLARLEKCPYKDCECRRVWRDVVEKDLAGQMGKISRSISNGKANGIKGRKTRSR